MFDGCSLKLAMSTKLKLTNFDVRLKNDNLEEVLKLYTLSHEIEEINLNEAWTYLLELIESRRIETTK